MNLEEPFTLNTRPIFQALMDRPREERIAAYRDPAWRARAIEQLSTGYVYRWHKMSVAESPSRPDLADRPVLDLASEWGVSPLDAVLDLSLADDLQTRFWSIVANDDREVVAWLLPRDNVLLGLADSGAHVSQLCDACFATDLLGQWVRDKGVLTLERGACPPAGAPLRYPIRVQ
jgi:N-acyl-D-aspartate/D-glutamate deacylase